jgi:hypothetical protein
MYSPELSSKIELWRQKSARGELTRDEQKEIVSALRQERVAAHFASTTSRTKKASDAAPVDTAGLLKGFLGGP